MDALAQIQDPRSQILGVQGSIQGGRDRTHGAMDPHTADLTTSALGLGIAQATVVTDHDRSNQVGPARRARISVLIPPDGRRQAPAVALRWYLPYLWAAGTLGQRLPHERMLWMWAQGAYCKILPTRVK